MKEPKDKPLTVAQLKSLHAALNKAGIDEDDRHDLIYELTNGRTRSSKDLTTNEAFILINSFRTAVDAQKREQFCKLFKSIYHLSMKISFLNKGFPSSGIDEYHMNIAKINLFARSKSKAQKDVNKMTIQELEDFKKQLEAIFRKEQVL